MHRVPWASPELQTELTITTGSVNVFVQGYELDLAVNDFRITRRRIFSIGEMLCVLALRPKLALAAEASFSESLPAWSPGFLDIHHIDTGRGSCSFVRAPDGTSILIDCGASNTSLAETSPLRPNDSRSPAGWVAHYIVKHAPEVTNSGLDFIVATHIHPDHIGDIPQHGTIGSDGYVPTGLSEIDQLIPAKCVIDRSYPDFGDQLPPDAPFTKNYIAWLDARLRAGRTVEAAKVGSSKQICSRSKHFSPNFSIRTVAGNGKVWTGKSTRARDVRGRKFPSSQRLNENSLSIALVIQLGSFKYFSGGDLSCDTFDGRQPWADVETPTARAVGRVEVALANHHGYFDAIGAEADRLLNPQAYVIPSWHITHPGQLQVQRMLRAWPNEKIRDVFALGLLPQNRQMNARFDKLLKSTLGHVVVRVHPDGSRYEIFVLDSTSKETSVLGRFGPYKTRN